MTPRGYGWSVRATVDGFNVVDRYTETVVDTFPTRRAAWDAVTVLSNARYAKEAA